ncbi:ArsR/SmtB family transcription factor [Amycolatopsis xylanica]|uniref:ArsR/SmtB family transcription factor n=1 Tax=Amycolatopsis xylanica TaxID=589385 RepID=UPI000ACA46B8|nr:DUF5937 family protein [Amycolatopsis xylanica]
MPQFALTAQDMAHTRFAFSPLWECVASVRVLKDPGGHAVHLPWAKRAQQRISQAGLDIRLLGDLVPDRQLPAFLTPTPSTPVPDLEHELDVLRDVPARVVRRDLDTMDSYGSGGLAKFYRDPAKGLERLASLIEAYWALVLEPCWRRISALLEAEVLHRARLLAEHGAERLLDDLSPMVAWHEGALTVAHAHLHAVHPLGARGLVLVPSAFAWPKVYSKTDPRWQPVLRYPARGLAGLWDEGGAAAPRELAAVVGRGRAILLTELAAPVATSELAARTRMTPAAVRGQLTTLRAAGLVSAQKVGRETLYVRTGAADGLVASGGEVDC